MSAAVGTLIHIYYSDEFDAFDRFCMLWKTTEIVEPSFVQRAAASLRPSLAV